MTIKSERKVTLEKIENILLEKSEFLEHQLWLAGLHMVLFEFLKDMVRENLESFFANSWELDESGKLKYSNFDPEYEHLFIGAGRKRFESQLGELKAMGAIDDDDIDLIHFFRDQRNDVAHRLIQILTDDKVPTIDPMHVKALLGLVYKIDNWWFREVEAGIQPELYDQHPKEAVDEGHTLATQLLITFVNQIVDKIEGNLERDAPSEAT